MKAEELRLGNIVNLGKPEEIIWKIDFKRGKGSLPNGYEVDLFTPIPLTEEWLLKFGFEKETGKLKRFNRAMSSPPLDVVGDFYVRSDNALYFEVVNGEFEFRIWNGTLCKIKYVHQLQNLYFALTGEELTINQQG